jgi:redox-sensitive bicupin YhaK (pirin superfamily)
MISVRRAGDRGETHLDWLDSRHTFSFADYYDPAQMGFGALRVINEDRVAPGGGFATHGHRDMEILTWVLDGALAHRDSLGNGSIIRPGEMQRMTAGTGIRHSEFNASQSDPVHFLQIWILPERRDLAPGYAQEAFAASELIDRLKLIASPDGRDGSVIVHQDVALYAGKLANGAGISHRLAPERRAWLQVTRGDVRVGSTLLAAGDGMACTEMGEIVIEIAAADRSAEVLLFDLA